MILAAISTLFKSAYEPYMPEVRDTKIYHKVKTPGAEEVAQLVRCLPLKREGLCSIPRTVYIARINCIHCPGEAETGEDLRIPQLV